MFEVSAQLYLRSPHGAVSRKYTWSFKCRVYCTVHGAVLEFTEGLFLRDLRRPEHVESA
jgi:hypothetical protein